jgi:hypothetical protein
VSDEANRRSVLEAIAFGSDERISPGDRLRAVEALGELPPPPSAETVGLTIEEIEAEVDDWHAMMLSAMFVASGPEAVADGELDPTRYPMTRRALLEAVARLAERVRAEDEAAGHWGEPLEPLPAPEADAQPEPEPEDADVVPEPEPERPRLIEPPAGVDLARGW